MNLHNLHNFMISHHLTILKKYKKLLSLKIKIILKKQIKSKKIKIVLKSKKFDCKY